MTNIIEQLLHCDCSEHCKSGCIQKRAAEEIKRLRADLEQHKFAIGVLASGGIIPINTPDYLKAKNVRRAGGTRAHRI
jgi:hypothetical protein